MSTDPLQEKFPHISTYAYTFQNPIKYIDPDGKIGLPITPAGHGATEWFRQKYVTNYTNRKQNGESTLSAIGNVSGDMVSDALSLTDVNDVTVLVTTVNRGGDGINIDGTSATTIDKVGATAGVFLPFVSGSAIIKLAKKLGLGDKLGGAYGRMSNLYDDLGNLVTNKNHIPSFNSYKLADFKISQYMGSAQIMSVADHAKYISTGSGETAKAFRTLEASYLKQGKFMDAFELNATAIRKQFGSKYDQSINQAREHFQKEVIPILEKQM